MPCPRSLACCPRPGSLGLQSGFPKGPQRPEPPPLCVALGKTFKYQTNYKRCDSPKFRFYGVPLSRSKPPEPTHITSLEQASLEGARAWRRILPCSSGSHSLDCTWPLVHSVQSPLLAWGRAGARRAGGGTSCLAPEGEVTPAVMSLSLSRPLRDSSGHDAFPPPVPVIHLHSGHHRIAPGVPSAGR